MSREGRTLIRANKRNFSLRQIIEPAEAELTPREMKYVQQVLRDYLWEVDKTGPHSESVLSARAFVWDALAKLERVSPP